MSREHEPEKVVSLRGWKFQLAKGKAFCARPPGGSRADDVWFPWSQVKEGEGEVRDAARDQVVSFGISEWLAREKGIEADEDGEVSMPAGADVDLSADRNAPAKGTVLRNAVGAMIAPLIDQVTKLEGSVRLLESRLGNENVVSTGINVADHESRLGTLEGHVSALIRSDAAVKKSLGALLVHLETTTLGQGLPQECKDALHEAHRAMSTSPIDQAGERTAAARHEEAARAEAAREEANREAGQEQAKEAAADDDVPY